MRAGYGIGHGCLFRGRSWGRALRDSTLSILITALSIVLPAFGSAAAGPGPENLALGKPYQLAPVPRYEHCTDPADRTQLTDGQVAKGYFWTQPETVGWVNTGYAAITVDLGRVEPIEGVALRTAAGVAGVEWPRAIRIQLSEDGTTFYDVAELVALDHQENGPLPEQGYAVRRFVTHQLHARGRYVRWLVILAGPFGFADEVEVLRGSPAALEQPLAGRRAAQNPAEEFTKWTVAAGIQRRLEADRRGVEQQIAASPLADEAVRQRLRQEVDVVGEQLTLDTVDVQDFRAVLPFSPVHQQLFVVQGRLWQALGRPPLTAWTACPWDPLDLYGVPPASGGGTVQVHTMLGEHRAAALNLANSTDRPQTVRVQLADLPGGTAPDWLGVHVVPWTDTQQGRPVAAALPVRAATNGAWQVQVLPGMVTQLWLAFHVTDLPAGVYRGHCVVRPETGTDLRVPLELHVYPLHFPQRTTLLCGGWSYTNGGGSYGITAANRALLLEHLQSRGVNGPWASGSSLFNVRFDEAGRIALDTREMDDWLAQWPHGVRYHVFASVPESFGGAPLGSDRFHAAVADWIHAWVAHLEKRGVSADRLALLLADEPNEHKDVRAIVAWARAIRAAEPKVVIWEDPTYQNPAATPAELWEACDVVCPNRVMWLDSQAVAEFYRQLGRRGKVLQFYSCSGPARLLDPYSYYRLQAWHCWDVGATGSFFWAFGDNSGTSSWNEYAGSRFGFTPLMLDDTSVTAAKQMEAIRESTEDYEYLVMLDQAAKRAAGTAGQTAAVARARQLLQAGVRELVSAPGTDQIQWHTAKDRTGADQLRVQVLQLLTELQSQ